MGLAANPPTAKTDRRRLYLLVGLAVLLGLAAIGMSAPAVLDGIIGTASRPSWGFVVTLVALIAIGDLLNIEVRVRSTLHGTTWTDAAVLIGLAILPGPWVVLAALIGVATARAIRRFQPIKIVFAASKESTTAFVGGLMLSVLDAVGSPQEPARIPALAVVFVVMTVVDQALAIPVIARASHTRVRDRVLHDWDIQLLALAGRFAVAAGAVLALQVQQDLLYGLPLAVLFIFLWHERWVRAREERQAWQNLAAATESFSGVDLDVVLHAAVTRGSKLFSADQIEVEVWLGGGRRLVRGAEQVTYDGDPAQAPPNGTSVYAVALHGYAGRRDIGALRLRFRNRIKVSDREQAMLGTYAAALDTAVRNAAAYGQLGEATAAHAYAAAHDGLTGLANRRELERELQAAIAASEHVALVLIDLRHFKEVNDALGHLAGDQVLVEVARRLTSAAAPDDLVTRFGGDEFAILLRDVGIPAQARLRGEQLLRKLAEPMEVDGLPIVVEANGGLALANDPQDEPDPVDDLDLEFSLDIDDDGEDEEPEEPEPQRPTTPEDPAEWMAELMRRADVAMYQAKRISQPLVCYTMAQDPADRERLTLAGQLPRAVSQREFVLHFQPIVDLATGEVVAAEALARWRHPTRGELEPRWFLDLLERSAQLPAFTAAVLDDALAAANVWRAAGHDLRVAVNISARSLLDTSLPRQVLDALDRHHTSPDRLCLELTETLALSQLDTVDQVLTQLHDIGVRLALDDFGTGFSSLAVLSRIPVHQLKVDRSFVHALRDPYPTLEASYPEPDAEAAVQARAVVRSTVQLGRALDLSVVAEGIENVRQRTLLWELGCTAGQGHLFARPKPADRLLAELTSGVGGEAGTLAAPLHAPTPSARNGTNVVPLPKPRRPTSE